MRAWEQCWLCKACGHQFTSEFGRHTGRDEAMAAALRSVGLSLRTVAMIFGVNASTICRWVRNYGEQMTKTSQFSIPVSYEEMIEFVREKETVSRTKKSTVLQKIKWETPFGRR